MISFFFAHKNIFNFFCLLPSRFGAYAIDFPYGIAVFFAPSIHRYDRFWWQGEKNDAWVRNCWYYFEQIQLITNICRLQQWWHRTSTAPPCLSNDSHINPHTPTHTLTIIYRNQKKEYSHKHQHGMNNLNEYRTGRATHVPNSVTQSICAESQRKMRDIHSANNENVDNECTYDGNTSK